jgi:hypothetical protein
MDLPLVTAGALIAVWPLTYRRSMRRIAARISERSGDVDRFKAHMDRRWIRAALLVAPFAGAIIVVLGVVDS